MAYSPFTRVTVSGVFGSIQNPKEIWSWGFQLGGFAAPNPTQYEQIEQRIEQLHGDANAKIGNKAFLLSVKFSEVGADGLVIGNPYVVEPINPIPGGGGASPYPWQVSVGVGLRTRQRGPSKRGRFYLPAPTVPISDTDGTISVGNVGTITGAVGDALYDINQIAKQQAGVVGIVVASSRGYNTVVKDVSVGQVLDTQRRRRGELEEAYQFYENIDS